MNTSMKKTLLTMRAHQYLYYVRCRPVISDYAYDCFCKEHGLHGGGGSDCACDYTPEEIAHAEQESEQYAKRLETT